MSNALTPGELIRAVKDHAIANYEKDGWDFVVEAMTDAEIYEDVKLCRSAKGAIAKMKTIANLLNEQRQNARDW